MGSIIAIDGPAGSGKSTLARSLGDVLGLHVLDTGAMYRAAALKVIYVMGKEQSGTLTEVSSDKSWSLHVAEIVKKSVIVIEDRVSLDGQDVTEEIRTDQVDGFVSFVASIPAVRKDLVSRQRQWIAMHNGGVVEGRDIGTVVCPDADLKIYLTASIEARAERRAGERTTGERAKLESMIDRRDELDMNRSTGALPSLELAALAESAGRDDMIVIDSTEHDASDVLSIVLARLEKVGIHPPSTQIGYETDEI